MMMPLQKSHLLFKIVNNVIVDVPLPSNISTFWNLGSLLGLCLIMQITTSLFLTMRYISHIDLAFSSVIHICRNVNYSWFLRNTMLMEHTFFFICLYIHIERSIYFSSYMNLHTWMMSVIILLMVMASVFLGYVLLWGQMFFWSATIIMNLFSTIPYIGIDLVQWIWGSFSVDNATLTLFHFFHFILPLMAAAFSMIHILFLHQANANNLLGISSQPDKMPFHPYFTFKNIVKFIMMLTVLLFLTLLTPYFLGDTDNFIPANPLVTPPHIQPEWYFLFAYIILRSISNKLGGVIALVTSVIILMILPFTHMSKFQSLVFYPFNQILFWIFVVIVLLLTWIGAGPVEDLYIFTGQVLTILYFLINLLSLIWWDNMFK
uniref:Cytochrome b n=1 Tax=Metopaulias depressus TaxID=72635 RepID=A0A191TF72_9EUCA|nr:cytochrome b [Metopaulias depressus]